MIRRHMALWALVVISTFTAGCSTQPITVVDSALFSVTLLDNPRPEWGPGTVAVTYGGGTGFSRVEILRDYYPECMTHEVRHVFEGQWHPGQPTTCIIERR